MPGTCRFTPQNFNDKDLQTVTMTIDEYETIRLIDFKDFSQEEC